MAQGERREEGGDRPAQARREEGGGTASRPVLRSSARGVEVLREASRTAADRGRAGEQGLGGGAGMGARRRAWAGSAGVGERRGRRDGRTTARGGTARRRRFPAGT